MIHLVTAATPDYPWVKPFWDSVEKYTSYAPGECTLTPINIVRRCLVTTPGYQGMARAIEPYPSDRFTVPMPTNRAKCMQHGEFLQYLSIWGPRDVVMWCDADMIMQRRFTLDELEGLRGIVEDEVVCAINGGLDETLEDEARLLFEHDVHNGKLDRSQWENLEGMLDMTLPGWQELPNRNAGVIVARVATYRRLYDLTRMILPFIENAFSYPAAIQFAISYAVGFGLRGRILPQSIHTHGHFGMPLGASWDADGDICWDGEKAVFRHAMNLTPVKGPGPKPPCSIPILE